MTEKEIYKGLIKAKDLGNNVVFFKRNIRDITTKIDDAKNATDKSKLFAKFKRYIDLNNDNRIDEEICKRLDTLKNKKILECSGMSKEGVDKNIFEFDVKKKQMQKTFTIRLIFE